MAETNVKRTQRDLSHEDFIAVDYRDADTGYLFFFDVIQAT